jgi:hypothetical protein
MKKITTIEKDGFYLWIEKPKTPKEKNKVKDVLIGDSVGGIIRSTGMIKFKKFFEKDLKKERSVAYRYESRFKKEKGTTWFLISQVELNKGRVQGCKTFNQITVLKPNDLVTPNGKRPIKKKSFFYVITF